MVDAPDKDFDGSSQRRIVLARNMTIYFKLGEWEYVHRINMLPFFFAGRAFGTPILALKDPFPYKNVVRNEICTKICVKTAFWGILSDGNCIISIQ